VSAAAEIDTQFWSVEDLNDGPQKFACTSLLRNALGQARRGEYRDCMVVTWDRRGRLSSYWTDSLPATQRIGALELLKAEVIEQLNLGVCSHEDDTDTDPGED
jgi:hypothetical protein